ncbi:MAG: hypothetical protein ABII85_01835 [Bacillota bacterium]
MSEISIEQQLKGVLNEYRKNNLRPQIEKGLDAAANTLKRNLEEAIPSGDTNPHFKSSWIIKNKYKGVRYVGNTKKVKYKEGKRVTREVPLSNILEYAVSSKHKGSIGRTVRKSKSAVKSAFEQSFKKGE